MGHTAWGALPKIKRKILVIQWNISIKVQGSLENGSTFFKVPAYTETGANIRHCRKFKTLCTFSEGIQKTMRMPKETMLHMARMKEKRLGSLSLGLVIDLVPGKVPTF